MKQTSQQDQLEILRLYKGNVALKDIASRYGVTVTTVMNIKRRHQVKNRRVTYTTESGQDLILEAYSRLRTVRKVCEELGCDRNTAARVLHSIGVNDLTQSSAREKQQIKTNAFQDLSSLTVQYFLGLMATDGCISSCLRKVSFSSKDLDLITSVSDFVGGVKIYPYDDPRFPHLEICHSLKYTQPETARMLNDLGITPRKSLTLKMNMPLNYAFLRGVIDGNGSVISWSKNSVYLEIATSSVMFLEQLKEFLESDGFEVRTSEGRSKNCSSFKLIVSGKPQMIRLYNLLYTDASHWLERKRVKFDVIR